MMSASVTAGTVTAGIPATGAVTAGTAGVIARWIAGSTYSPVHAVFVALFFMVAATAFPRPSVIDAPPRTCRIRCGARLVILQPTVIHARPCAYAVFVVVAVRKSGGVGGTSVIEG